MTNARPLAVVAVLACVGCAGEVSGGSDGVLAEFPSIVPTAPPAGVRQADWDAESVDDETRSTHLWLVNRAIDLLATRPDLTQAADVVALLRASDCQPSWHQGLADADFKAAYNGGWFDVPVGASTTQLVLSGATWASHFYDPDTGRNYKGQTSPTAYDQGLAHLGNARAALGGGNRATGCYELGLSLHYFTDLTQPMHASNYTATNYPVELHSDYESYAMAQQARFVATSWSGPTSGDPSAQLLATAKAVKPMWPVLKTAIANAYAARGCGKFSSYWTDHTSCWEGDATVDGDLGAELRASQSATANYLYATALR
jgi:phospholipase C